jgi:hypothetical protein
MPCFLPLAFFLPLLPPPAVASVMLTVDVVVLLESPAVAALVLPDVFELLHAIPG